MLCSVLEFIQDWAVAVYSVLADTLWHLIENRNSLIKSIEQEEFFKIIKTLILKLTVCILHKLRFPKVPRLDLCSSPLTFIIHPIVSTLHNCNYHIPMMVRTDLLNPRPHHKVHSQPPFFLILLGSEDLHFQNCQIRTQ